MIVQNAHVRQRGERWQGVARSKDRHGWHDKTKMFDKSVKSERQAKKALVEWLVDLEAQADEDGGFGSYSYVPDYLYDYINMLDETGAIEKSTVRDYRGSVSRIRRSFDRTKLRDLTTKALQDWERDMLKSGGADGGPMHPSTVLKTHRFFKQACSHAVTVGDLPKNPFDGVRAPKAGKTRPNSLYRRDRASINVALSQMEPTPLVTGAAMALYEGMREGEICGLRWRSCDLKSGTITVEDAIGLAAGGPYVKQPKNASSARTISIAGGLMPFLKRRRVLMMEQCMEAGVPFSDDLYVIGRIDGTFTPPYDLSRGWRDLSRGLGLVGTQGKPVTFHDLRHSFATTAIAEGADISSVAALLGHSNVAMTLNVYADADPEAKRAAMERVNAATDCEVPQTGLVVNFR